MAKFDLKFSNIVKVVLVILLVVGLYNLVYNSNVFNYSMYEGFDTKDEFAKVTKAYQNAANSAKSAMTNPPFDKFKVDMDEAHKSTLNLIELIKTKNPEWNNLTHKLLETIGKAREISNKMKTRIAKGMDVKDAAQDTLVDILAETILDSENQLKDLQIYYPNLSKTDKTESFDNLYPSKDDQSINSSLMQPYASYKCGPINPGKFFFDNIEFKPDCCPSTYYSSQGCACLSPQQINYLNSRGGNRTCPTEY